ncbi:TniQ family protein [Azospirillum sp. INR13]|uniref:TnsD family Tn7-like transposition protein n=1 Tax=Azospirillum sp. INR13 TaxID=2596919 RepID=UPI0018925F97
MLPYFPAIYPDETLYSVVARYHRHTAANSVKETLIDLFGSRAVRLTPVLVGRLGDLARRLPPDRNLTPERLALSTTFYPYCVAYEPAPVRHAVLSGLIRPAGDRADAGWDIAAGPAHFPAALRCCPVCLVEAAERFGEAYWRRAHQLPGVMLCPEHAVPLITADTAGRAESQRLIPAPLLSDFAKPSLPAWARHGPCATLLLDIARRSCLLLSALPAEKTATTRLDALAARGLTEGPTRADHRASCEAFAGFVDPIRSVLPEVRGTNWLRSMTNPDGPPIHPLHHVLFDLLLETLPVASLPKAPATFSMRGRIAPVGALVWERKTP